MFFIVCWRILFFLFHISDTLLQARLRGPLEKKVGGLISVVKAKKSIGRDWSHDCLRHSYASYHFAEFNDAGLTAKNLGHPDSTLLRKDYNGAVTKAQAKEFWAIQPSDCR
jgi:hypothetical protein